jgi:capsular polysaccharide biosynthesis protein
VEANEAVRRIFWRHRWLLIACLIAPVLIVVPLRLTQPVKYAATANIQAQGTPPQVDTEVSAILSRVSAIATSPAIVQHAINVAGVNRNAVYVARHEVSTTTLSSSAIVALTVTDPNPTVAVRLAKTLSDAVIGGLDGVGIQSSLAVLSRQWDQLTATRERLISQISAAQSAGNSGRVSTLTNELNAVEAQISANLSSEQQILSTSGVSQGSAVISVPSSATLTSRHTPAYAALAALLGLVIGLLIAAIHELARPTVAEPRAAARELGTVLLGDAEITAERLSGVDGDLPARLSLAADRSRARTLVLTGPVPTAQLAALARRLGDLPAIGGSPNGESPLRPEDSMSLNPPPHVRVQPKDGSRPGAAEPRSGAPDPVGGAVGTISEPAPDAGQAGSRLIAVALSDMTLRARPEDPALVVVLPEFAPRAALDRAEDLATATGWPVLGVIGLRKRRGHAGSGAR